MRKIMNRTMSLLFVAIMAFSLAACGASGDNSGAAPAESKAAGETAGAQTGSSGEKIVNVGVTDTLR